MLFAQGLLIAFFLFASSVKIVGWVKPVFKVQLAFFHRYGLNRASMFAVGVIEACGAVLILCGLLAGNSLFSALGASMIALTSIGALFFHIRFDKFKDAIPSIVTLCLSAWVLVVMLETVLG